MLEAKSPPAKDERPYTEGVAPGQDEGVSTHQNPATDDSPQSVASLEHLSRTECLNLLALAQVGRVGFVVDGQPQILPVNYALDGDTILFRTDESSALNQASMTDVAFEVDSIDDSTQSGWSVLARGRGECIADAIDATSERIRRLTLTTWAPGERDRWFTIRPSSITGRRLRVLPIQY
jgi:nitroimidazol reductase NimA-like FMN-containing flavoprotein (pyridoxamine 5'-phosphate oxidase superfamily)